MAELSPDDLERLTKLLGMLGSEFIGERAAAGALANTLVLSHNLTWGDIVKPRQVAVVRESKPKQEITFWINAGIVLADHYDILTNWEKDFLESFLDRGREPTEKQQAVLNRIFRRAGLVKRQSA